MEKDKSQIATEEGESFHTVLSKFTKVYRKMSYKAIEGHGLAPAEIDVLMFLFNNPSLDMAKDISRCKGISKALICRSADSLCKRGLISTKVDKNDRRIVHLSLTDDASEIVDKLKESKDIFSNKIKEGIEEDDMRVFTRVLKAMMDNVSRLGDE